MGTRARVGIVNADGTITSIYTHWDGYPSHHGPILLGHYNTEDKVRALLALGDLSSLGEKLGEKHDFDDRTQRDWCTAYFRDRGETECEARASRNNIALYSVAHHCDAEYIYVFGTPSGLPDPSWWVCKVPRYSHWEHTWQQLGTVVERELKLEAMRWSTPLRPRIFPQTSQTTE